MNDLLGCRFAGGCILCIGIFLMASAFFFGSYFDFIHEQAFFRKYMFIPIFSAGGILFLLGLWYLIFPFAASPLEVMIMIDVSMFFLPLSPAMVLLSVKLSRRETASLSAEKNEANLHEPPIPQKITLKDVILLFLMVLPLFVCLVLFFLYIKEFM